MLRTPALAYWSRSASTSARVWPTQVRWAMVGKPCSAFMFTTSSRVRSWVDPSAPYVTEAKEGSSTQRSSSAERNRRSASSVRGGKNSRDRVGPARRSVAMVVIAPPKSTVNPVATRPRAQRRTRWRPS